MIRDPAAKELAHSLLDCYVRSGFCTPELVEQAATLIQLAVSTDEERQKVEQLQREIDERELRLAGAR